MSKITLIILWVITTILCREASAAIVINEFLADPPLGLAGDANHDGVRHSSEDEFVELLNFGEAEVDLSNWSLWDRMNLRHQFAEGATLPGWNRFVIFGGGNPQSIPSLVVIASSGMLSLNNPGDEIFLKDFFGNAVDHILYGSEGNQDQSLTRLPEGSGPFQLHSQASSSGLLFSPGTDVEGKTEFSVPAVPEPSAGTFFVFILLITVLVKGRRRIQRLRRICCRDIRSRPS